MKRLTNYLFLVISVALTLGASATAAPPPPESKTQKLESVQEKLNEEKRLKSSLQSQVKDLEKDLHTTKNKLLGLSTDIRANEKTLQDLEKRIAEMEVRKAELLAKLENGQEQTARLLLALERIRRVPPQALILKPDTPYKTAQSALLLQDIVPMLQRQAKELRSDIKELESLRSDLDEKRKIAEATSGKLKSEYQTLASLVDQREGLFRKTETDLKEQEEHVKTISKQARSLQDLVAKLEDDKKRAQAREQSKKAVLTALPKVLPRTGDAQLPISGVVTVQYNDTDSFGAPSKGISISGRKQALVVAPMGGVVRFAGYFKNHGNLIIIEHKKGYHSLVAGLEKIDTVVGQSVSSGEPIGRMGQSAEGGNPVLYYELRLNGAPINPAQKFAGLG